MNWALEVPGVTRAWPVPQYFGRGTIGIAFVLDNDPLSIFPDETKRQEVRDYIVFHTDPVTGLDVGIPATAEPGLIMIELGPKTIDFNIDLDPNDAAVQASVREKLEEVFFAESEPGSGPSYSQMSEAISSAVNEIRNRLNIPSIDISANINELPIVGDITFNEYF